ncbi:exo-alpha-sialidase [Schlesneria paludicola]|uniref:exo-alpha-sialidase n=1 Tax=Schlesneria paludicola TaxID=360056 RepID=UPI00138B14CD|nr:exo-alpha-sialidase [Schlesneria paludicola]
MHGFRILKSVATCCLVFFCSSAIAAVELGQSVGEFSVLDARDKPLAVTTSPERTAIALVFLSARSDAVDKSLQNISTLYRKHRRLGVVYIGICSNEVESAEELGNFARDRGLIFTIYRDPAAEVAGKLGITTNPSVALIDSAGKLAHRGGLESKAGLLAFDAAVTNNVTPRKKEDSIKPTPIAHPGEKQKKLDNFGSLSFSSELLFERIPDASVYHCSTIAEAANGDLLCLWYGGSYESADDQTLFLARRRAGERAWQEPQAILKGPDPLPGNGVIFVDGHKRVWIVWCRMESVRPIGRGQGWDKCRLMARVSTDHGLTWSSDTEFLDQKLLAVPRNPPILLSSGNLVLPLEAIVDGVEGSIFLIGADGGKQWRRGGFTPGGSQPAVIQRRDKSLFALMRKAPRLTQIESRDGGDNWSQATPSSLRNPDSGISMTQLANGHAVVVFNDTELNRTPLSIARSIDEGHTWETPLHLESNPGEYSYPCVIQTSDGKIHITYTYRRYSIKHVELNEDWLTHIERPN